MILAAVVLLTEISIGVYLCIFAIFNRPKKLKLKPDSPFEHFCRVCGHGMPNTNCAHCRRLRGNCRSLINKDYGIKMTRDHVHRQLVISSKDFCIVLPEDVLLESNKTKKPIYLRSDYGNQTRHSTGFDSRRSEPEARRSPSSHGFKSKYTTSS